MSINRGIKAANRESVAIELAKILANEYVLYTKTKNAHWFIERPDFYDKHKFIEAQFGELYIIIDLVSERIRSLGHYADAMLKAFLSVTQFTQQKRKKNDTQSYLIGLLADHEIIITSLKKDISVFAHDYNDIGASNFISELMETHEKITWFLRLHLNN
jgi:starvation-inducible DNA-binding protein